jgi:LysM repeat protein
MSLDSKQTPSGMVWTKDDITGEFRLAPDPLLVEAPCETAVGQILSNPAITSPPPPPADEAADTVYILHTINRNTETLEGICIKYGTSVGAVKRLNNFTSFMLAPDVIRIPPNARGINKADSAEQRLAAEAMQRTALALKLKALFPSLSQLEASVYLSTNDYDYDKAVLEAKGDVEWEESERGKKRVDRSKRVSVEMDNRIAFSKEHDNDHLKLSPGGVQLKKTPSKSVAEGGGGGGSVVQPFDPRVDAMVMDGDEVVLDKADL